MVSGACTGEVSDGCRILNLPLVRVRRTPHRRSETVVLGSDLCGAGAGGSLPALEVGNIIMITVLAIGAQLCIVGDEWWSSYQNPAVDPARKAEPMTLTGEALQIDDRGRNNRSVDPTTHIFKRKKEYYQC